MGKPVGQPYFEAVQDRRTTYHRRNLRFVQHFEHQYHNGLKCCLRLDVSQTGQWWLDHAADFQAKSKVQVLDVGFLKKGGLKAALFANSSQSVAHNSSSSE